MTRFMLVRHGVCAQTDSVLMGRSVDDPLDERGRRQAATLAQQFPASMHASVHSSPRRRTQQTAAAIATRLGVEVHAAPALDEIDFGRWSGASFSDLELDPDWRAWNERRAVARTPAGDSMEQVQKRVIDYLRALHETQPGRTLVLATHAEVIRAALLHCLGLSLDEYCRFPVDPASCTTLRMHRTGIRVDAVNAPAPLLRRSDGERRRHYDARETAR